MQDTSIKTYTDYSRLSPDSNANRDRAIRVFRIQPERIQVQVRNERHYMTATLTAMDVERLIVALKEGLKEIIPADALVD